ncbi:hypothetical protein [Rhodopseudomonas telluris]|uniref:Uncharacterized protein n=1 Tax=Rhodopseudomonas telluris TaxID=644215 RepID=A0ABV6ERK2_9BRAD
MSLIGHLFAIAFGFLFASIAAGVIVVGAMLFPEISAVTDAPLDQDTMNIVLGFGFIFVSGFALVPALIVVLVTEAFSIRSALAYAIGGGLVGVGCYLGLVPFDPATLHFDGIVRRHLEIMTGAGIVGGLVYWLIAGRNAGLWRDPPRSRAPLQAPPGRSQSAPSQPTPPAAPPPAA